MMTDGFTQIGMVLEASESQAELDSPHSMDHTRISPSSESGIIVGRKQRRSRVLGGPC